MAEKGKFTEITQEGIASILSRLGFVEKNPYKCISEYIWNGFDAKATCVKINYTINQVGKIDSLEIIDNGEGIPFDELEHKFTPFYQSEKILENLDDSHHSIPHGKRGLGRLTFFGISHKAIWETTYKKEKSGFSYSIEIDLNNIKKYTPSEEKRSNNNTGTTVVFKNFKTGFKRKFESDPLEAYLLLEFGWFLELCQSKNFSIIINGKALDTKNAIDDKKEYILKYPKSEIQFNIKYVCWKSSPTNEYSKFYYLGSEGIEKYKETTTLNNKGDDFNHSVYIKSPMFDKFLFEKEPDKEQELIAGAKRKSPEFTFLINELEEYLRRKRKPFLKKTSYKVIEELKEEGILEKEPKTEIELIGTQDAEQVIKGMYEIQPKIFARLNPAQKKTFIGMLRLILDGEQRDDLINIVEHVVRLEQSERAELAELLKVTSLSNIIKTIAMIKKRYEVLKIIEKLHFDPIGAKEKHLQQIIESNTWVFGEQYSILATSETTFEKALVKFRKEFCEDEVDKATFNYTNNQPDLIIVRQNKTSQEIIHNIVVEIKHPEKKLGQKYIQQIERYCGEIKNQAQFNGETYTWEYILIGLAFDNSNYIEGRIDTAKVHGKKGLIFTSKNHEVFVKKWCDIINEAKIRLEFLDKKLQLRRDELAKEITTPELAVTSAKDAN